MRILNAAQMREADRFTIEDIGIPSLVLMENAGRQVVAAMEAAYEARLDGRVAVLCGRGNNGGDGFVVARTLPQRGIDAAVFVVGGAGRRARRRAHQPRHPRPSRHHRRGGRTTSRPGSCTSPRSRSARSIVDAIFGTGLKSRAHRDDGDGRRRRQRIGHSDRRRSICRAGSSADTPHLHRRLHRRHDDRHARGAEAAARAAARRSVRRRRRDRRHRHPARGPRRARRPAHRAADARAACASSSSRAPPTRTRATSAASRSWPARAARPAPRILAAMGALQVGRRPGHRRHAGVVPADRGVDGARVHDRAARRSRRQRDRRGRRSRAGAAPGRHRVRPGPRARRRA